MNRAEFESMDPRLEQAMTEIRSDSVDNAVVEAAAARVWERLAAVQKGEHIRGCADFQALIPEFKAGHLPAAKMTLVRDHLHECVHCRRVYEGRVVSMPAASAPSRRTPMFRWAAAAVVVMGVGSVVWFAYQQYGGGSGRTIVQAVNGTLYQVGEDGSLKPIPAGSELADGMEIRTAKDSDAMVQLRDGSVVELRERSGFSTMATATDLTVRLGRGSIIVQAAKRRKGHLYVATADCRVAVTGTVFSVVSGVKGSRVSVVEGEVHVSLDNQDHVLHPGGQFVTSQTMEPGSVKDDVSWSRDRDKLIQQLQKLSTGIQQIHMPAVRYSSRLLDRLPAETAIFGSIPNPGRYLFEAQGVLNQTMGQSPELRQWWAGKGMQIEQVVEIIRQASEFLGDEVVMFAVDNGSKRLEGPIFLAEAKDGFSEFLKKHIPDAAVETRPGMVVFGGTAAGVKTAAAALDNPNPGFKGTPFYGRIAEAYRGGAGLLLCADLTRTTDGPEGMSYFIGEQKEVRNQMEMRATLGFSGERQGIAGWLAAPATMGSLDYISPDAALVAGFVVKDPKAILDQIVPVGERMLGPAQPPQNGAALKADIIAALGGEFSVSFDGPIFPPSWKLITEVYDPVRAQSALQRVVEAFNSEAERRSGQPLRTAQETAEGRTYYMIAGSPPNPLTEAHYTFADGYLIAGPTRALVSKALQIKTAGTSISRSAKFQELTPRDHYANFSAIVYQNLGSTLAPLAGLLGSFVPPEAQRNGQNAIAALQNMKPMLVAAYAENDRITVAAGGNFLAQGLQGLMSGNVLGMVGGPMGAPMQMRQRHAVPAAR
jgi:ferric-dicitrate binding protein FerR (iron transport regulator)